MRNLMPNIHLRIAAWIAIACCSMAAGPAGSETPDIAAFSLTPAALLELAASPAASDDFVVAFQRESFRYEFDEHHRLTLTTHQIYRIDSTEAVEDYGQIGSQWEPYRQKKPELRARVVTPDGREHVFDPATLADETIATGDARKFDDLHYLRGPLPAIAPGSVVEVLTVVSDVEPQFSSGSSFTVAVGSHGAVESTSITIITPKDLPFSHETRLLPDAVISTGELTGAREFTLRQGPISLDWEDAYVESAGDVQLWPRLIFSTGRSWDDVATQYGKLVEPAIRPDEVRALLPGELPTEPRQRLAALLRILHERVRYTGVFFGQGDIVPNPPAVTLERRYGDCKDKSVVLASMLRAAGMPAQVVLLNSGTGGDIDPDLPGIGGFNHMIVHVPGDDEFWIDATAQYLGAGEVHYDNTGRWALLVGPAQRALVRTPEMVPADSRELERRDVGLAEIGWGDIRVEARFNGATASAYRQLADSENKSGRDSLLEQYRTNYSAKTATGFEIRENPASGELVTTLELRKVEAAATNLQETGVAMSLADLFVGIPYGLRNKEPVKKDPAADDEASPESAPATRTLDWVFQPFQSELQVKVVPPKGFRLRAVPKDVEKSFGPLIYRQTYREEADGSFTATIRTDSVRGRYSADEGRAFRKAYLAEEGSLVLTVRFDHESWQLARNGKPADAVRRHSELIAAEPRKSIHRVRAAAQFIDFGLVDEAKSQALRATEIDSNSAWAFNILGVARLHDGLGRRFGKGFDRDGAIRAFREAIKLDPDGMEFRVNLGAAAEVNSAGVRFGTGSDLDVAIESYKEVVAKRPEWEFGKQALLNALWHRQKYDEVVSTASAAENDKFAAMMLLAARVMIVGPDAALREDATRTNGADHRVRVAAAMTLLLAQRQYDEARAMAAAIGIEELPQDSGPVVAMLENISRVEELPDPETTASGTAESLVRLMFRESIEKKDLSPWLSERARQESNFDAVMKEFKSAIEFVSQAAASRIGGDPAFIRDMVLSNVDLQETAFARSAKRVMVTVGGTRVGGFILVPEESSWKMLAMYPYSPAVAWEALSLLDAGDVAAAGEWVAAVKADITSYSNSEYGTYKNFLAALPDARAQVDPVALRIATLALLVVNAPETVKAEDLRRAADGLGTGTQQEVLEFVRFTVARDAGDGVAALAAAESFGRLKPGSMEAHSMLAQAYAILGRWDDSERTSRDWMAQRPGDIGAKQALVRALNGQGRFADALETWAAEVRQGTANATQLNSYAWQALVAGAVDPFAVKAAENAHMQWQRRNYASAHTLACLYADQGRVSEARRVLLQMLEDHPREDPLSGDIWLIRGLIAESLGENRSATTSYRSIQKPDRDSADSSYAIATARLSRIEGSAAARTAR